jgi:predicted TIM-barrel fold metal-dependent hydrolase
MDACNVTAIVNLDGRWGDELEQNLVRYDRAHPARFATFCHPDWSALSANGFGERIAAGIRRSVAAGARGVKVWKDLGLHLRGPSGELVMPDDPRLAPVWDCIADVGVPAAVHIADPVAFFDPPDQFNERLEELAANPHWWFGDRDRFPPFERIIESLEAVVAAHPSTTFIGVHVGCYAEDLGWVDRMLTTYPNFNVDIAARIAELGRQPRRARRLIVEHPDRVLFGTDLFPPDTGTYAVHFRFLETADEHFRYSTDDPPPQGRWAISGLDLPDEVLRSVYETNARRLVPGLAG